MDVPESVASEVSSPNLSAKSFTIRDSRWRGMVALGLLILVIVLEVYELLTERDTNLLVFSMLVLVLLVNGSLIVSRLRDFGGIRRQMVDEHRKLEQERKAREHADAALQARLDTDRRDRLDNEWIEVAATPIRSQMAATIVSSEIADLLMEGLGRTLDADFVVFYSFGKFENLKLARQWSQSASTQIDVSRIPQYDSALLSLAKRLGNRSHVIVVEDSYQLDVSRDPYPELLAASRELSRSWLMAPVGEAIHGMGYVWIGMVKDPRVWSAAEVGFVKRMVTDATQLLAHAWMIGQSMQIAENDAEVNRLVELDQIKNDFIENMNHELRTPLTSIIGYLEVIMDDVDVDSDPGLASSLVAVQRNALRLQILIENMMQLSKTDFDILPLVASTVNVGQLLGDVVNSLKLGGDESGVGVCPRFG